MVTRTTSETSAIKFEIQLNCEPITFCMACDNSSKTWWLVSLLHCFPCICIEKLVVSFFKRWLTDHI